MLQQSLSHHEGSLPSSRGCNRKQSVPQYENRMSCARKGSQRPSPIGRRPRRALWSGRIEKVSRGPLAALSTACHVSPQVLLSYFQRTRGPPPDLPDQRRRSLRWMYVVFWFYQPLVLLSSLREGVQHRRRKASFL